MKCVTLIDLGYVGTLVYSMQLGPEMASEATPGHLLVGGGIPSDMPSDPLAGVCLCKYSSTVTGLVDPNSKFRPCYTSGTMMKDCVLVTI